MLLNKLSEDLGVPQAYLLSLAKSSSHRYKSYKILKSDGGMRTILHPAKELKAVQRYLLDNVLIDLPVHSAAAAYIKGRGLRQHAEIHKSNRFLLRLDFVDFFPSLTSEDIQKHLLKYKSHFNLEWTEKDTSLLSMFVCHYNKLTIGAVTSPILSNTLCYDFDKSISDFCVSKDITYSRYADDMYFSTNKTKILFEMENEVELLIRKIEYPSKLYLNPRKTRHKSKKYRRSVTGLIITPDQKISIGRPKKRYLKSLVYKWESLDNDKKEYLKGYLSYCRSVEPSFINSLYKKYGAPRLKQIFNFRIKIDNNK